ncbi:hypothetical protein ACC719_11385 [Rhizobium ruizarguesonis]
MRREAVSQLGEYPTEVVIEAGGTKLVEKFLNKIAGADANKDGRDFELSFGVYRTILEMAALINACRHGDELPYLDEYRFWDRPIALVDDFYIYGLTGHFYAQLKFGNFTWANINADIRPQRKMDAEIGLDVRYRAVIGNADREQYLLESIRAAKISDVDVEVFQFSTEFNELIDENPRLAPALHAITGSRRTVDQETAYETFFYQYWKTRHEQKFVWHAIICAQRKRDFIPPLKRPPIYDYLGTALSEACTGCDARVVGQMVRITKGGALRTYLLPSDHEIDKTIRWLDNRVVEFHELTNELEEMGWQRPVV